MAAAGRARTRPGRLARLRQEGVGVGLEEGQRVAGGYGAVGAHGDDRGRRSGAHGHVGETGGHRRRRQLARVQRRGEGGPGALVGRVAQQPVSAVGSADQHHRTRAAGHQPNIVAGAERRVGGYPGGGGDARREGAVAATPHNEAAAARRPGRVGGALPGAPHMSAPHQEGGGHEHRDQQAGGLDRTDPAEQAPACGRRGGRLRHGVTRSSRRARRASSCGLLRVPPVRLILGLSVGNGGGSCRPSAGRGAGAGSPRPAGGPRRGGGGGRRPPPPPRPPATHS